MDNLLKDILQDVKVELLEEFKENFRRKAFFDKKWKETKLTNPRGSLMMRSGALRRSIRGTIGTNGISFSSSLPYAKLHNEGGTITVTRQMKRFFWAKFYETAGGGKKTALSVQAQQWKALALQKVGSKMQIEQRQFIGDHPRVKKAIGNVIDGKMRALYQKDIQISLIFI